MNSVFRFFIFLLVLPAGGVLGAEPLGEGVAANEVDAQGKAFPSFNSDSTDEILLPEIVTYVDAPVVEQRTVFTQEDIQNLHAESLSDLVKQSGLQSLEYGAYGLETKPSIRGFTDETVRVVIDGICMNNAQSGTFDFSSINIDDVESVEIVRGGFTEGTEDEGATGGAIYITTKKNGQEKNLSFDTALKTFFNQSYPLDTIIQSVAFSSPVAQKSYFSVSAKGAFAKNAYIYEGAKKKLKTREHTAVKDATSDIRFSHWNNGNRLTVNGSFYYGDKQTPGKGEYSQNQGRGRQKDLNADFTVQSFNPSLFNKLNLTTNLAYLYTKRRYKSSSGSSLHKINDFKGSAQADFFKTGKVAQSAGLSFDFTHLNSTNSGVHIQPSGVLKETTKVFFNDYFSATIPLAVKFCGENYAFIPKAGFAAKFSKIEIMIDGYRMIQFPNMDDLYWEGDGMHGNPDLKPEEGWGADLTFNLINRILPCSIQFFTNYYEKKITWSGNVTQNLNSAYYFGIDFNAQQSFFNDFIFIFASGEYLYNALLDKSNTSTYKKRIMWTPDFTGSLQIKFNLKKFDFSATAQYTGKRYTSNSNLYFLKPYTLVNLCLNLNLWKYTTIYFKGDNILNERYQSIDDYPMPGASLTAGCKVKIKGSAFE